VKVTKAGKEKYRQMGVKGDTFLYGEEKAWEGLRGSYR